MSRTEQGMVSVARAEVGKEEVRNFEVGCTQSPTSGSLILVPRYKGGSTKLQLP